MRQPIPCPPRDFCIALRIGPHPFSHFWQQVNRRTDGTHVKPGCRGRHLLQPVRTDARGDRTYFRLTDSLRDDSRTNAPILIAGPNGVSRTVPNATNLFHVDALLSYQPMPGTVVFAGYGSDMLDEEAFGFRGLTRTNDAVFVKFSYLFRL